jgi:hypothetical protein
LKFKSGNSHVQSLISIVKSLGRKSLVLGGISFIVGFAFHLNYVRGKFDFLTSSLNTHVVQSKKDNHRKDFPLKALEIKINQSAIDKLFESKKETLLPVIFDNKEYMANIKANKSGWFTVQGVPLLPEKGEKDFYLEKIDQLESIDGYSFRNFLQYKNIVHYQKETIAIVINGKFDGTYNIYFNKKKDFHAHNKYHQTGAIYDIQEGLKVAKLTPKRVKWLQHKVRENIALDFDIQKTATFFAAFDSFNLSSFNNLSKLYWLKNQATGKLSPIFSREVSIIEKDSLYPHQTFISKASQIPHLAPLLEDIGFMQLYISELKRNLSLNVNLFLEKYDYDIKRYYSLLNYNSFQTCCYTFHSKLKSFTKVLDLQLLSPFGAINTYLEKEDNHSTHITIHVRKITPIKILGFENTKKELIPLKSPIILPGKSYREAMVYHTVVFNTLVKNITKIMYQVVGLEKIYSSYFYPFSPIDSSLSLNHLLKEKKLKGNISGVKVDHLSKKVSFSGTIYISENIIIPAKYNIDFKPGTKITLIKNASIISYSPIFINGEKNSPVLITAGPGSKSGIVVMNNSRKSIIRHALFDKLSEPQIGSWIVTGAVTFYQSPVDIFNSKFVNNTSEDSLNIINSKFTLENSSFRNISSDAFDADFCEGTINNVSFINVKNDAMDFSTSVITINKAYTKTIGDKSISAGEKSTVHATDVNVNSSRFAFVSKDSSSLSITNSRAKDIKIGYSAYQKKSIFGPSMIKSNNVLLENFESKYIIEKESRLQLDQLDIFGKVSNLKEDFYQ